MSKISTIAIAAALMAGACAQTMDQASDMSMDEKTDAQVSQKADDMPVGSAPTTGMSSVMVGGAEMSPRATIVENASKSADHTTLISAVKSAGLETTLSGTGPFTVFAPTNAAFDKLPPALLTSLQQPANKGRLTSVLTYHVVPGRVTAADLMQQIEAGGGRATLRTAQGGTLTATSDASGVTVTDGKGNAARVTTADVAQSNGVVHVVDTVLIPG